MNKTQLHATLIGLLVIVSTTTLARIHRTTQGDLTHYDIEIEGIEFEPSIVHQKRLIRPILKGVDGNDAILWEIGKPEIPVVRFYVDGESEITLLKETSSHRRYKIAHPLRPSLAPVPRLPGRSSPWAWDASAYRSTQFSPSDSLEVVRMGSIGGIPRFMVTLYPFRYRAGTDEILLRNHFTLQVRAISKPSRIPEKQAFAFVIGKRFASSPALQRLIADKERQGYLTYRILVGGSLQEPQAIRQALRHHYQNPGASLRHALLIGDAADVPGFVSPRVSGVTDHYYRCLDTEDYESDIGTPDITVGRWAVESEEELSIVLGKQLKYDSRNFSDKSWFDRMSLIATNDSEPTNWKMAEGTLNYAIDTYLLKGGIYGRFPNDPQKGGDQLYAITHHATGNQVAGELQHGRSLVNYGGHGGITAWSGPEFTAEDVKRLAHPDALPLIASHACYTGRFIEDSFGEAWLRHRNGGILFWGSMDMLFWSETDDRIGRAQFDAIYRDGTLELGAGIHYAISEGWKFLGINEQSKYYWETYVILGDPSTRLVQR